MTDLLVQLDAQSSQILAQLPIQLLYATIIAAGAGIITALLRNRHPALQAALWALVLVRLAIPVDLSSPLSARHLLAHAWPQLESRWPDWLVVPTGASASAPLADAAMQATPEAEVLSPAGHSGWALAVLLAWGAIAGTVALLHARRRRRMRAIIDNAAPVDAEPLVLMLAEWRWRFAIRRPVRLVSSNDFHQPFTLGSRRPAIFLPAALLQQPDAAVIEPVIAHELAHIRHHDDFWLQMQRLVQIVYFFFPLAWLAGRRISAARERLCDQAVLNQGKVSRRSYGRSLLAVLQLGAGTAQPAATVPGFSNAGRQMRRRLQAILYAPNSGLSRRSAAGLALLAGMVLLPLAPVPARLTAKTAGMEQPQVAAWQQAGFAAPLAGGRLTATFGRMRDPFSVDTLLHTGIDLAAPLGTPVLATADGIVDSVATTYQKNRGRGRLIVLRHANGYQSAYNHLQRIEVERGQTVRAGDTIGTVGVTGRTTGPHLHFEIYHHGQPVDPLALIEWTGGSNRNRK